MILSQQFIKLDNKLFDTLSTQEMYVYCYLKYRYIYQAGYTETSVDILADNISFVKDKSTNKKRIRDVLLKLQQQAVINIKYKNKIENNSALRIDMPDTDTQFTKLDYKYMNVEDHQELYVIAIISKWQNAKEKTFSQTKWAKMLGVARSTMQDIFRRMEEKGLILVRTGDFYMAENGQILRQENEYCLAGDSRVEVEVDVELDTKNVNAGSTKKEKSAKTTRSSGVWIDENGLINGKYTDKRLLECDNLITGKRLGDEDFVIYLTTKDEKLKKHIDEVVFYNLRKTENGKLFVEGKLRKIRQELAQKKAQQQQEEYISNMAPPDRLEWEYKKRDKEEIG